MLEFREFGAMCLKKLLVWQMVEIPWLCKVLELVLEWMYEQICFNSCLVGMIR